MPADTDIGSSDLVDNVESKPLTCSDKLTSQIYGLKDVRIIWTYLKIKFEDCFPWNKTQPSAALLKAN